MVICIRAAGIFIIKQCVTQREISLKFVPQSKWVSKNDATYELLEIH